MKTSTSLTVHILGAITQAIIGTEAFTTGQNGFATFCLVWFLFAVINIAFLISKIKEKEDG